MIATRVPVHTRKRFESYECENVILLWAVILAHKTYETM